MTVVGISMAKDEADIIETTVRHMLGQVDYVIVADNMSTDGTRAVLDSIADVDSHLLVVDDFEPAYFQSQKMTALALRARLQMGATWIVPFDADEIWHTRSVSRIADVLTQWRSWDIVPAQLYDHVVTDLDDPRLYDPTMRLQWRRPYCAPLPKVACRWNLDLVIEQGNHGAHATGSYGRTATSQLVIRHFPYRSAEQVIRKVRNGSEAYKAGGEAIPGAYGAHWRQWGQILEHSGEEAIKALFERWYCRAQPDQTLEIEGELQPPLVYDPAPVT